MLALTLALAATSSVIDAERAFAQLAQDKGQWTAFRATAAPEARMFLPKPTRIEDALKDAKDPAKSVRWWPVAAWQSCDGTLGVTTGGAIWPDGHASRYTTIWRRQPDGAWKWIYDNGRTVGEAPAEPASLTVALPNCRKTLKALPRGNGHLALPGDGGASADGTLHYGYTMRPGASDDDWGHSLVVGMWDGEDWPAVLGEDFGGQ